MCNFQTSQVRNGWLVWAAALLVFTGTPLLALPDVNGKDTPAAQVSDPAGAAHIKIGPGDLLRVSVFEEPELTQTIRVADTGDADLQLIGSMHLAGLTTSDAQRSIEGELQKRNYMLHPQVAIFIQEYGTQGVSVIGEVAHPGIYPVLGSKNLLDVISAAGGTTAMASNQATIKRRSGKQEKVTTALSRTNVDELLGSRVEIEPGDTVILPRAGIVYVIGEVGRPGGFVMQDDGKMTVLQAVALAAGVKRTASENHTRLLQKTASGFTETRIELRRLLEGKDPDIVLQPNDILYVPTSAAKSFLAMAPTLTQSAASAVVYQGVAAIP